MVIQFEFPSSNKDKYGLKGVRCFFTLPPRLLLDANVLGQFACKFPYHLVSTWDREWSKLYTLGPKVGILYVLGALG